MSKVSKIVSKIAAASLAVVMAVCAAPQVSFAYVDDGSTSYVINFYDDILLDSVTKNGESVEIADNQADYEDTITVKKGATVSVKVTGLDSISFYFRNCIDKGSWQSLSESVTTVSELEKSVKVPGDATVDLEARSGGIQVYIQMNKSEVEGIADGLDYGVAITEDGIIAVDRNEEELGFYPESFIDQQTVPAGTKLSFSLESVWRREPNAHWICFMVEDENGEDVEVPEADVTRTQDSAQEEIAEYTLTEDSEIMIYVTPEYQDVSVYIYPVDDNDPTPSDPTPSNPTDDAKGTTDGSTGTTNDTAKTPVPGGDAENLVLWIALFVVSGGCIAFAGNRKRSMNR